MPEFPYRLRGSEAVAALVETVQSAPDFVAGCLVSGGAHGYTMELEYMQRRDGTFRYRLAEDVQGTISSQERTMTFDLERELAALRAENLADRVLPDDPQSERRMLIVLANREGGAWVDTPAPGRLQSRDGDTALDRIFRMVGL